MNDCPVGYTPHALGSLPSDCQGCSDYLERRTTEQPVPIGYHDMTVEFSTVDDQIHLICSCGTDVACGFGPTPSELFDKEQQHEREAQS